MFAEHIWDEILKTVHKPKHLESQTKMNMNKLWANSPDNVSTAMSETTHMDWWSLPGIEMVNLGMVDPAALLITIIGASMNSPLIIGLNCALKWFIQ